MVNELEDQTHTKHRQQS